METNVKVIAASVNAEGKRILTLQCTYWRAIHGEIMTHRVFSRNAMSSRAVPVKKMLAQVWSHPAEPVHWGRNNPGMQSKSELTGWRKWLARKLWRGAAKAAVVFAWTLDKLGGHKQWVNRLLEPWQWMHTIITATDWENFFELRCHADAQPEFQKLACMIKEEAEKATYTYMAIGEWHLPYVTPKERLSLTTDLALKVSAARCARVSYLTHDGKTPSTEADLNLFERLAGSRPLHASPLEHQATPGESHTGNFTGWTQHRKLWEASIKYNLDN